MDSEWNGMEWNGIMEWIRNGMNGMEWNGMEWMDEWNGRKWNGMEGLDWSEDEGMVGLMNGWMDGMETKHNVSGSGSFING